MNEAILHKEVQKFIKEHLNSDITSLILKGNPFTEVSIQEIANQILCKQKAKSKLPIWFQNDAIYFPNKLNLEQTSSEATAEYKASLVSGKNLIDLTGGFGIDSYYFSKNFDIVIHCELNEELSKIAQHNFKSLEIDNVITKALNGIEYLKNVNDSFDTIFIDPSRRNDAKGKVFLLEDCLPDVTKYLDLFFSKSNQILIKLSPMLDISNTLRSLKFVKEVHVVALENEVKELLFLLEKDYKDNIIYKTINIRKKGSQFFNFDEPSQNEATLSLPLNYLYEPNAAILKSGAFNAVANQLQVLKLQKHSHLYTSNDLIDFPGRRFKIEQCLKYDKKGFKKLGIKKANIAIRNFPKSVAQLRKELKINDGGQQYLFFTKNSNQQLITLICSKV